MIELLAFSRRFKLFPSSKILNYIARIRIRNLILSRIATFYFQFRKESKNNTQEILIPIKIETELLD
jgi:hypothetical protein